MDTTSFTNLSDSRKGLLEGRFTALELCESYLVKAEADDLNAFLEVFRDSATNAANALDQKIKAGSGVG